jgi:hypothetical protein
MWRRLLTNARQPPEFDGRALREAAASLESLFADLDARTLENGGGKLDHGSGGIGPLRAA